MTLMIPFL